MVFYGALNLAVRDRLGLYLSSRSGMKHRRCFGKARHGNGLSYCNGNCRKPDLQHPQATTARQQILALAG